MRPAVGLGDPQRGQELGYGLRKVLVLVVQLGRNLHVLGKLLIAREDVWT
jgi:hypothetical protein